MADMENLIDHVIKNKILFGFWYLTDYGRLVKHTIDFTKVYADQYLYTEELSGNYYSEKELKEKLLELLPSFNMNWKSMMSYQGPLFLSYSYIDSSGEKKDLVSEYLVPFQITCFTSGLADDDKDKINITLHKDYLEKFEEYVLIREFVLNEIESFNPERAKKINIDKVSPDEILYVA